MKYKLIGDNNWLNPIETILKNRGIIDIDKFLNLDATVTHDWRLLKNIEKAIECFIHHIKNNNKIYIQVDSDADGYLSASLLINYIHRIYEKSNIIWNLHEGKEHGVVLKNIPNDVKLVIIPDAGSNQYKEHLELNEKGIEVIVLDHHQCDKESEYAIVVNNQLSPNYPNKNFSGVGIVYKFCKGLDETLKFNYADQFLDLVAIGNIADSMDLRELETRYYVLKGLEQINNPLLKELLIKQEYSTKGIINITNIAFYIVPLLNATIRVGSIDEKLNMMKALLESKEHIFNKKKNEHEHIATYMARTMYNIRARQNRLRDKGLEAIEQRIKEKNLNNNKIMIVNVTDILDQSLTGLVAIKIATLYRKPTLLLRLNEDGLFGGSGRGYEKGHIKNFRQFLLDTGKFEFVEGHEEAFGILISPEKIVELNDYVNELLKDVEIGENVYDVDFILMANDINKNFVKEIYKLRDIWCKGIEEPLILIKNIKINKDDIELIGKNRNTIKFTYKEIEFIKFNSSEDEYENIVKGDTIVFTIVGKCSENEWEGEVKSQVIIEDYTFEVKKKEYVF